ncbi:MAG: DUF6398 domain-containing protein [Gemmatimonadaceae bacterium]
MTSQDNDHVPVRLRSRVEEIDALTGAIAAAHLDDEYAALCRRMTAALARQRPSLLERGEARTWAAAIVHAAGWVNFLTDPAQDPHMTAAQLAAAAGVGQSTIAANSRKIRDALRLSRFDPDWTLPSKLADNPFIWLIEVDGLPMDVRDAPPAIQAEAFRRGLIPFIPGPAADVDAFDDEDDLPDIDDVDDFDDLDDLDEPPTPAGAAGSDAGSAFQDAWTMAEEVLRRALDTNPDATMDELDAALAAATSGYNHRPQAELGGLSPADVQLLLDADWTSAASAIRLDTSLSLADLACSRTLDDARLVLGMMAEQGSVKATPKGNLPRVFVAAFRDRMGPRGSDFEEREHGRGGPSHALNEEDAFSLHIARLLVELAGLVKRRKGVFSRTRRGEKLTDSGNAGELFAALVHAHFRLLSLAYLDAAAPAPGFQYTIGYTLYQFGRSAVDWKPADELVDALVLPAVVDELPVSEYFDSAGFILQTRFLRPLEGFGLAESRELAREPGEVLTRREWRKTPLFDQVVRFELAGGG